MAADMKMHGTDHAYADADADAEAEEKLQYEYSGLSEQELNEKYPNRPHNHSKTLRFWELINLFNKLNENRKRPVGPSRRKVGPKGPSHMTTTELRDSYIEQFISKWRKQVGNDFYPALRLMLPEKDRDRGMYGLKEASIGKLFVKIMGLNKTSDDAIALTKWKLPGQRASSTAGDFAARCNEIIKERPILLEPGKLTIAEVNAMLDQLSVASKEHEQAPIFDDFYRQMNPEELMWLIRIMLRQMKVGATEKTLLFLWHPDAESLFNVSSSLRRVCWELYDPEVRLNTDASQITLMQCFQPELAAFSMNSFQKIVEKMRPEAEDQVFWIEEKLDGERMQMHMTRDESMPGGFRFAFWSRKAKDYTYLYGNSFHDPNGSMTRHLAKAFDSKVQNIVLDGEMITWNVELDAMVAFGHLKTAALFEQRNPYADGIRPLFRVFDCLYLNDKPLTKYSLRDRRKALDRSVNTVHRRLETHSFTEATTSQEIEQALRKVVQESSEGLVVKNPRSMYKHDRTEDWIKVKPEYMNEFGEDLDCVIVGGYFGSGHRGGRLSSFLCALRYDEPEASAFDAQKCWSFFKVGGGMAASDYQEIYHLTEGKWNNWDRKKPPTQYIELGGGEQRQYEQPDQWILPSDSVVVSVKAASVHTTDQFRTGFTLRFPRFKSLRKDKTWEQALSIKEFHILRRNVEQQQQEKRTEMDFEKKTKRKTSSKRKRALEIVGNGQSINAFAGPDTELFKGRTFYVMSGSTDPEKKSKGELEEMIISNGGNVVQDYKGLDGTMCVSENRAVKAVALQKRNSHSIVKPSWLFHCIQQNQIDAGRQRFLLPFEPSHMFFTLLQDVDMIAANVDSNGDSYCRDLSIRTLQRLAATMPVPPGQAEDVGKLSETLEKRDIDVEGYPGFIFRRTLMYFDHEDDNLDMSYAQSCVLFGQGKVTKSISDEAITHVVVDPSTTDLQGIKSLMAKRSRMPRLVTRDWVLSCWNERTMIDEERRFMTPTASFEARLTCRN